jgi:hemoglobin/transferrin/lactoferrin receptor protein
VYPAGGLKSVNAENSYIGLEVKGGGLSPELSGLTRAVKLFKTNIDDLRDEEFGGGPDIYSELESDGFEINGRYDWQSGFARVSYADIDVEINGIEGGTEAKYIGTALGRSLRGDFIHAYDYTGITIGADVQHYFEEDGTDTFSTPMRQQGAFEEYTVVNAFVGYTPLVFQDLTLRATVSNVFDETYVDRTSYGQEYTNTFDTQLSNEQGRSVLQSAELRFQNII